MAASRTRRKATGRGAPTVGEARRGGFGTRLLVAAALTFAVSVVIFVAVAADAFGGGSGGPFAPAPGDPTAPGENPSVSPEPRTVEPSVPPATSPTPSPTPGPDGTITVPCGDILVPLDKQHRLPADCEPPDLVELPATVSVGTQYLRAEAARALLALFDAAARDGHALVVNSAYRSYQVQVETYSYWVRLYGQEQADRTSARPGHSEHQLGTAADVGARGLFLEDFIGTPEAAWLAENAWKHGFVVSYPEGKEHITGYAYEPWHIRFVGRDVAAEVHRSGLTLREFLLAR